MQFIGCGISSVLSLGIIFLNASPDPTEYRGLAGKLGAWDLKMQAQRLTPHLALGDPRDATSLS